MGCGKTTVALELSRILGYDYLDLDCHIETKYKMKITEIFEKFGEDYFRDIEKKELVIVGYDNLVVAAGGGLFVSKESAEIAKERGILIHLKAPFKECYRRIKNDKSRPLVKNKTMEELSLLYDERERCYLENSHFSVNSDTVLTKIVDNIVDELMKFSKK